MGVGQDAIRVDTGGRPLRFKERIQVMIVAASDHVSGLLCALQMTAGPDEVH